MDDRSLVADFIARRPIGFERAYEAYAVELCSVARHVLNDAAWAEDCVHDALLRVWRSPGCFRAERGSLRAFLITCVRNEALSELRSASRRAGRERKALRLEPPTDEMRVVDHVEAARVRDAIAHLPPEQRDVILRAYYGNRTQAQIAEETQVPLGTVKSRASLALLKLKAELSGLRSA